MLPACVPLPTEPQQRFSHPAIKACHPSHQSSCLHRRQQQLRNVVDSSSVQPERIRPMHGVMSRSRHVAWRDSRCQQDGTCAQRTDHLLLSHEQPSGAFSCQ